MTVIQFMMLLSLLGGVSSSLGVQPSYSSKIASETTIKKLGQMGDWIAFMSQEKGNPIYYMVSFPIKQEGDYKKRGKPYLMITHRPADKSYNVVSFHAGYKFSKEIKPKVIATMGKITKDFELFVEGESAWTPSDDIDTKLTKIIINKADSLMIIAESFKGTQTKDTYSLKGSLAAYQTICQKADYKSKL